jgi:hypothetical protein
MGVEQGSTSISHDSGAGGRPRGSLTWHATRRVRPDSWANSSVTVEVTLLQRPPPKCSAVSKYFRKRRELSA